MYNSYTLYTSTIQAPPFRPPSSSVLDRSLIELQLKKPSFLIHHEETVKQPNSQAFSTKIQTYQLSKDSLARLERLQRNPFLKNNRIYPKITQFQHHKNPSWLGQSQPVRTPQDMQNTRDIILNLEKQYFKKYEPIPEPEVNKDFRVQQILAEIARQNCPESPHTKLLQQKQKKQFKINSKANLDYEEYQHPWKMVKEISKEEQSQSFAPIKETATIIHQLTEDNMQNSKQIVSSQVEAFGSPQPERQDPITFWARREVQASKITKEPSQKIVKEPTRISQVPQSITIKGVIFELIPVF